MTVAALDSQRNAGRWAALVPFESPSSVLFGVILFAAVLSRAVAPSEFLGLWLFAAVAAQFVFLTWSHMARPSHRGLGRLGFHFAMLAYFFITPLFSPSTIKSISRDIHNDLGATLLLTVIGFELAYWRWQKRSRPSFEKHVRRIPLIELSIIGLASAIASLVLRAIALRVSVQSVIYSMRGQIWTASVQDVTPVMYYTLFGLSSAAYLGGAAASAYLISHDRARSNWQRILCWSVLISIAGLGLRQGSRALFLYSAAPFVATAWQLLSRSTIRTTRWVFLAALSLAVLAVWGFMSAARGGDVRDFAGTWEDMSPERHLEGAFDIYSEAAVIVEVFPANFAYEHGRSLVPIFLGWIPRTLWPSKPYPFGVFANYANWETIQNRSASIAVGLPGEGYGNFGILGGLLWGILAGLGASALDRYATNLSDENPLRLQLAMIGAVWAAMIVRGGVAEMFYMGLFVICWPLLLSLYIERRSRTAS